MSKPKVRVIIYHGVPELADNLLLVDIRVITSPDDDKVVQFQLPKVAVEELIGTLVQYHAAHEATNEPK